METPNADDTLLFDQNGNLEATLNIKGNNHNIILNCHSRQPRGQNQESVLNDIKFKLTDLRRRLLENATQNIKDQCDDSSWFWNWSGLDLENQCSLCDRKERLAEVVRAFTLERVHIVQEYANNKEDLRQPNTWGRIYKKTQ